MPIKNCTSKMPVSKSLEIIQKALVDHGATGFMYKYNQEGRIKSVKFVIPFKDRKVGFALPVNWRLFQAVLKDQDVRRWEDDDYCYRVAWANLRDWIESQMALLETEMIELPQIFLPFAVNKKGETFYDQVKENNFLLNFLLGEGK